MDKFTTQFDWATGGLVSVLGFGTVFVVLMIIMAILLIMEKIFAKNKKTSQTASVTEIKQEEKEVSYDKTDDFELVSVITAAIAASLNTSVYNLKIKSFKRVGSKNSLWGDSSKQENLYNRL